MILSSDLVYVGGGNTANLLAMWRVHGVDRALHDAWSDGVVLCGVSAGAICWFEAGVTDSFGPELQPLPPAYAADDGAAVLFEDTAVADLVGSRRGVAAYRVTGGTTGAVEERLAARLLPRHHVRLTST